MKFFKDEECCKKCAMWSLTILRVVIAIILINHGWIKLFGDNTQVLAFFESTVLPLPAVMMTLAGIIEVFGGILLVAGLFTRFVASIVVLEFVVIILFVKLTGGISHMELELAVFGSAVVLSNLGAGSLSLDSWLAEKKKNAPGAKQEDSVS